MEITSKQRAYLRSLSNNLDAIFQIGKASLTPEMTEAINEAFSNRELIKVSVLKNCADDPRELGEMIAERTGAVMVCTIGKKIILYKRDKENPQIVLPR